MKGLDCSRQPYQGEKSDRINEIHRIFIVFPVKG